MDVLVDLFFAILLFWLWVVFIKYRRNIKSWTGSFVWAERYLWNWWTYLVLILLWLFFMVWGVLYPFWGLEFMFWVDPDAPKDFKMR